MDEERRDMSNLAEVMRPKTLDEIIGNEHIVVPLRNQLANNSLSKAILITGISGSGKSTIAKILASSLNAEIHEIDCGADGSVDRMRQVVESSTTFSLFHKAKVFVLDEVHVLGKPAQSALLKTLEESHQDIYFILLTTELNKILPTIRTRCVVYETHPAGNTEIGIAVNRVISKYNLKIENMKDFWSVIEQSDGSLRQVYSLLEKLIAVADKGFVSSISFNFVLGVYSTNEETDDNLPKMFIERDVKGALETIKSQRKSGSNVVSTMIGLYNYLKVVYINNPKKVSSVLLADLALLVADKQIEWEHFDWLVWRHLTDG